MSVARSLDAAASPTHVRTGSNHAGLQSSKSACVVVVVSCQRSSSVSVPYTLPYGVWGAHCYPVWVCVSATARLAVVQIWLRSFFACFYLAFLPLPFPALLLVYDGTTPDDIDKPRESSTSDTAPSLDLMNQQVVVEAIFCLQWVIHTDRIAHTGMFKTK